MKSILVPVDGSDSSVRALSFAAHLARQAGATVQVLYVFDSWNEILAGFVLKDGREMDEMVERICTKRIAETIDRAKPEGVSIERIKRIGNPAQEIIAYAEHAQPDLIVMGSRGRSTIQELLVGSVSMKVVHRASVPVTVVK